MSELPLLRELLVAGGAAVLAAILLRRLRLPFITVLLLAGALVGPHGLRLVVDPRGIQRLADVGLVLLLFTLGLEMSLARLARIGRLVAFGGFSQVALTSAAWSMLAVALGFPPAQAVFLGLVVAQSSTAIVLRTLGERGEVDAPHGRFIFGALVFQDICVVPMMLLLPVLAGTRGGAMTRAVATALLQAGAVVALALLVARVVVPRLFAGVDRARSREAFLLSVLVVALGTAWLTSLAGLSLALGAFLAGVVLADSDYAHRALSDVLPLRDALTSLFFISLGMLFDPGVLVARPVEVTGLLLALLGIKAGAATLAALVMRFPLRVAVLAGVGLAQIGEFSLVLGQAGTALGIVPGEVWSSLLAAGILTMLITPLALRLAPHLAAGAAQLRPLARRLEARGIDEPSPEHARLGGHVVVAGFGVAGRILAGALREARTPYLVVELNAETVRRARAAGEPVYYGDVTGVETLAHARLAEARALVLLINDPDAAERAVGAARRVAPGVPVLVRARYVRDAERLGRLGASDVVIEEFEAGLEMLARALRHTGASPAESRRRIRQVRRGAFPRPHGPGAPPPPGPPRASPPGDGASPPTRLRRDRRLRRRGAGDGP